MPLNLDENQASYQVRAYQPGTIQINEKLYTHSLILTPQQLIEDWTPQTAEALTTHDLNEVLKLKPDLILIGTGEKHVFLKPEIYGPIINLGIGVEIMDTSAACRTFNALSAENRSVAAALIIR